MSDRACLAVILAGLVYLAPGGGAFVLLAAATIGYTLALGAASRADLTR